MADALALWQTSVDAQTASTYFNWGTVNQKSTGDLLFRVHNSSTVYSAISVVVSLADVGTPATPSQAATHLLSTDGLLFAATVTIDVIPPLSTTAPIILRRVTPAAATLGAFTYSVTATATSWL